MSQDELLRLRAYLDQEDAAIAKQWADTEPEAKQEFLEWIGSDSPSADEPEPEWIDFAARLALHWLQSRVLNQ